MAWKPIVVGVDATPASAAAARLGATIAEAAGAPCHLVHAARDVWADLAVVQLPEHVDEFRKSVLAGARAAVLKALSGAAPQAVLDGLVVRDGWPPAVLDDQVRESGAELLVLGVKPHTALGRWLGGSTVQNIARMLRTPLLVSRTAPDRIRRVLVSVDLSYAAAPTLRTALRYADLFGAEVRAVHAIEPLPLIPDAPPPPSLQDYETLIEEELKTKIWPLVTRPGVEKLVRHGAPDEVIILETQGWHPDLVVVGSHGKGWVDRMLLGSVTERLLHHVPGPMLVVPVERPVPSGTNPANAGRAVGAA